jgi:hypothetical protein
VTWSLPVLMCSLTGSTARLADRELGHGLK